jgi:DNA repair protein RecN (Recombination protein N)
MLTELRIENFAIIQELELTFQPGLTTFTGETGAGKSIILDAIMTLLGGRADTTLIRSGAERANVEGVFTIPSANREAICSLLEREGLLDDAQQLSLGRELRINGRSLARVNGRVVNTGLLRDLGAYLVDIHGQSEHLSLLNVRQHLRLLDHYAGAQAELGAYQVTYHELRRVVKELTALRESERDAARRIDLLEYQAGEIEAASLKPGEEEPLRQELTRLANAENLAGLSQQALTLLDEGTPETPAISDLLGQAVSALEALSRIDKDQTGLVENVQNAVDLLTEAARELRAYSESIEFNPRRLEQAEERLDLIQRLKRKYGGSIEAALEFARTARKELEQISHAGERIAELETRERELLKTLAAQGEALSRRRKEAAGALASAVEKELDDLNMAGARFEVDIHLQPDEKGLQLADGSRVAFDETGIDRVEFLIAPNLGEGLKPLVKIASGGETSRLMLALKKTLIEADSIPTLIFDEIDQGIGGRVGAVVGEKLWALGRQHQVLCVTHLPQLAAFGDQQLAVRKGVDGGRTTTRVEVLAGEARLAELAQMLGAVTPVNMDAARETLEMARGRAAQLAGGQR